MHYETTVTILSVALVLWLTWAKIMNTVRLNGWLKFESQVRNAWWNTSAFQHLQNSMPSSCENSLHFIEVSLLSSQNCFYSENVSYTVGKGWGHLEFYQTFLAGFSAL